MAPCFSVLGPSQTQIRLEAEPGSLLSTLQCPGAAQGHSWGRDTGTICHSHIVHSFLLQRSPPPSPPLSSFSGLLLYWQLLQQQHSSKMWLLFSTSFNSISWHSHCPIPGITSEGSRLHIVLTEQEQTKNNLRMMWKNKHYETSQCRGLMPHVCLWLQTQDPLLPLLGLWLQMGSQEGHFLLCWAGHLCSTDCHSHGSLQTLT